MKKLKSLLIVTLLIFIVRVVNGITPPNDKCSNSEIIKISKSGFGLGVFRSKAVLMKDATTDPGEFFESTLSNYGLNQKSIWFKFTLPTARSVNITLKQYGNNISVYSAGFAVYYSDDCNMNNDKLYKAKITPINMISSSFNPNLMTGTYYIQVGANNSVNDSLYIELNINKPDAMNQYDLSKDAYDFGIVPDLGKKQMNFEVGGQTIDDSTEVCSDVLGYNYRDFTGSAWFKFETNNLPGFLSVGIGSTEFNSPYSSSNPIIFGYRIYKGDITKNGANGVSLFKDCNKLIQYNSNLTGFGFDCGELDSNTIYSVQVFIHKAFSGNVMIEINNYRIKSEFPNIKSMIGKGEHILNHNNCSDSTKIIDGFGCNSMLQNNADSVLIPTVFENNGRTYDMNFWKIIKIENDANITMSIPNHGLGVYVKIFNGDVRKGKCDILLEGNDFDYPKIFNCMHAGIYSIQVLGTKKLYNYTEIGDNNESNFGKKYDIFFLVCDKKSINNFSLKDSLSIEKINMNNSLIDKNLYYTTSDTIGCRGTVFPGKLQGTTTNKIIYRTFRLDSSGLIRLFDLSPYFDYAIYKGDALDMAKKQNKWNEGDTLSEMEKIKEMFSTNNQDYYMGCLSAGIYTIASISKTSCSTYTESPIIIYNKTGITYSDSLHPGNLGDINKTMIWGDTVSKNIFSCDENFKVIDGHSCIDKSLMLYREFYISDSKNIMIQSSHKFNLFNGKVSEVGASGLKFEGNGCDKIWNKDSCYKLSIGWHTIVSYGDPKYDAGTVNFFVFICDTMTQFGNPAMPDFLDINIPDDSNVDFPGQYSEFYMKWETFPCDTNMGSCHCSLNGEEYKFCGKPGYRISFFMFKLYNPSYLEIRDLGKPLITELFPVDIRTVTKFSDIGIPVQPCIEPEPNLPLQFCNLQPGYYTFVVTGPEGIKFRPKLIIRNMKITKHDAAINSYDFGRIKGDGINYTGKEGDVPNGKYNVPSTDFFSCTAGAYRSDPGFNEVKPLCNAAKDYLFNEVSIPYPTPPNYAINANDSNNMTIPRRNIWYTFTSIGSGKITVTVKNKYNSRDTTSFPFSVYSSDEDGNKSFNQLNNEGKVDSTINQGLKFICNNSLTYVTDSGIVCGKNSDTASFWIGQCDNLKAKRYYVIVEMIDGWGASARCDVGIQFDTIHHFNLNYDYYSNANIINGKNEITEPYTKVKLDTGVYVGAKGCFACATRSPYDQDTCGTKTLWYKFEALNHTIFRINYDIPETQITDFKNNDVMLFKETLPGDSTINGLKNISLTPVNALSKPWGECFIDSGVYYIMFTGCNFIQESVIPRIWLINNPGDYCMNAVLLNSTNIGSVSNSLNIEGHTIGEGYGEDGSNMSCLSGPDGYKSSWFNLHLDMKDKVNLTFKLEENTNALSNEIRYRVFYGNCKSLTPGQCSSDALSQATLPCMRGGDYYIQVITPKESSGILNLTATSSLNPDVNCMPIDLLLPEVAFEVLDSCMGDTIKLKNKSSVGSNIEYKWNIDELSWESNEFEPNLYVQNQSAKKNITIRLIVKNLITNNSDTLEKKVVLWPKPKIKIERTVPNNGTEVVLNASIDFNCNSQDTTIKISTYKWIFGEGQSSDNDYLKGIKYIDTGKKDVSLIVGNKVCFSEVHDTFTVVMPPFARFDITDSCLGDTINFINKSTTGSNLTYKWMISSLDWESNEFEPRLLLPDQNTKMKFGIRLIVKDLITNASDTFDRQIIFLPALKLKIIETAPNNGKLSDVLCPGDTAILKVKTDVPISQTDIKWNTGDTGTDSIVVIAEKSMNYIVTVSESGNYCGTGIAGNNLTVTENYLNSKRIEKEICGSDSITPGVSQKPGYLYHWMPSEGINNTEIPNPGIWINKNKDYILKISNHEAGCFLEYDTINITYVAKPEFNLVNKLKMCPGSEITLEYKGKTDSTVTWTISTGKILSNDRILKVKENGKYIIAVKAKSCIFRDTTVVDYYPKPTAGMSLNTNTYAKQRNIIFKNTSSESDHYLWNFGDSTISKNESPTHQYQKGGKYKVILYAYNDKECVDSASTEILDILNDDVISSNVFTPNGDGYNDEFTVKIAGATKFKGQIFNRWGKKLFEWEDQNKGWDGKYLGEDCPTNTYFYIIEGDGPEINHTERKGWIEILR